VAAERWADAAAALGASLAIVAALYGPTSIEWAREAAKLGEVLLLAYVRPPVVLPNARSLTHSHMQCRSRAGACRPRPGPAHPQHAVWPGPPNGPRARAAPLRGCRHAARIAAMM
jgi:hypothetical protein